MIVTYPAITGADIGSVDIIAEEFRVSGIRSHESADPEPHRELRKKSSELFLHSILVGPGKRRHRRFAVKNKGFRVDEFLVYRLRKPEAHSFQDRLMLRILINGLIDPRDFQHP